MACTPLPLGLPAPLLGAPLPLLLLLPPLLLLPLLLPRLWAPASLAWAMAWSLSARLVSTSSSALRSWAGMRPDVHPGPPLEDMSRAEDIFARMLAKVFCRGGHGRGA